MNLAAAFTYGKEQLSMKGIADAPTDAWQLLEFVSGHGRAYYYAHSDEELTKEAEEAYKKYIKMRASHIPLQHITGKAYFMGMEFAVNEHVLVPRFDTEVLVEEVLKRLHGQERILDMCTGSGCILLSILHELPSCSGAGADLSTEALKVAEKNAKQLGCKAAFIHSDLFEHITDKYDIIVSNPPYIRTDVLPTLDIEVKDHEPHMALDGMEDGLYFYRKIIAQSEAYLCDNGLLCFEIGYDQGEEVSKLMAEAGYEQVEVIKDLCGLDRVVIGRR